MRAIAYVDALNLYHRGLRGGPHKWLDPAKLVEQTLRHIGDGSARLSACKLFTARVISTNSGTQDSSQRQKNYLAAVKATQRVEVVLGFMQRKNIHVPLNPKRANKMKWLRPCVDENTGWPKVHATQIEEKGSDVSLSAHLVLDAALKRCDVAVVVSNDADHAEAIRLVRDEVGVQVVLLCPDPRGPTEALKRVCTSVVTLQKSDYAGAQLALPPTSSLFQKPVGW